MVWGCLEYRHRLWWLNVHGHMHNLMWSTHWETTWRRTVVIKIHILLLLTDLHSNFPSFQSALQKYSLYTACVEVSSPPTEKHPLLLTEYTRHYCDNNSIAQQFRTETELKYFIQLKWLGNWGRSNVWVWNLVSTRTLAKTPMGPVTIRSDEGLSSTFHLKGCTMKQHVYSLHCDGVLSFNTPTESCTPLSKQNKTLWEVFHSSDD